MFHVRRKGRDILTSLNLVAYKTGPPSFGGSYVYPGRLLGRSLSRKVHEADPMVCPKCAETTKVVAFINQYAVVYRIIDHLKLKFVASEPPPSHVFTEVALMEAEESGENC